MSQMTPDMPDMTITPAPARRCNPLRSLIGITLVTPTAITLAVLVAIGFFLSAIHGGGQLPASDTVQTMQTATVAEITLNDRYESKIHLRGSLNGVPAGKQIWMVFVDPRGGIHVTDRQAFATSDTKFGGDYNLPATNTECDAHIEFYETDAEHGDQLAALVNKSVSEKSLTPVLSSLPASFHLIPRKENSYVAA